MISAVASKPTVGSCAALEAIKEMRNLVSPMPSGQYCRAMRVIEVFI